MQFIELMTKDLVGQLSLFTVGFLIFMGIGFGVYFFFKSGEKKDNQS
ncbi:MAG: hypothetical protein RIT27_1649 [Pseudomonadota bacterium]|jgi:hypothetical protein